MRAAVSLALVNAGSKRAARMAMTAITTSSSTRVNAWFFLVLRTDLFMRFLAGRSFLPRLISFLVAGRGNRNCVGLAGGIHGKFDVIAVAFFGDVRDEFI